MRIAFIGAGNAAWNLAIALSKAGNEIVLIVNRSPEKAERLAKEVDSKYSTSLVDLSNVVADLIIVSTRDDGYSQVASELKTKIPVVHTSGSIPMNVLLECSFQIGVFYPLQSMLQSRETNFLEVPFCLEANNQTLLATLNTLAKSISNVVLEINSEQRKQLHLGAIFASNFSNFLYILSKDYLRKNNLPEHILDPLITETANRIIGKEPADFQTGPARRGDFSVLQTHLKMLEGNPLMLKWKIEIHTKGVS